VLFEQQFENLGETRWTAGVGERNLKFSYRDYAAALLCAAERRLL